MKYAMLEKLLKEYHPKNTEEKVYKDQMLDFMKYHPETCFDRSLEIGHFTASCWLVNQDNSKALLMHHAKLKDWLQLGGHADGDSDLLAVAIKEGQEESGIVNIVPVDGKIFDLSIHLIPANPKEKAHYHYDVRFLLQVVSDEDFIKNHESLDLRWIGKNKNEIPTDNRSVIRMFEKWIARDIS